MICPIDGWQCTTDGGCIYPCETSEQGMNDFLAKLVLSVVKAHPDKVAQYATRPTVIGWFVGQVMKAVQGHADSAEVLALVKSERRAHDDRASSNNQTMEHRSFGHADRGAI
jgi:hypothetical protein